MKKGLIKGLAVLLLMLLVGLAWVITDATIHDFNPLPIVPAENISQGQQGQLPHTLTIVSWNLGYAGLGEEMDFFYDGGSRVRPKRLYFEDSQKDILAHLSLFNNKDIILLQEVDKPSKRSYFYDQPTLISQHLPWYHSAFAANYQVKHVPVPLGRPMGKVSSGLITMGKIMPTSAVRISLPGNFGWPTRLFMLDRCLLVTRYPYLGDKELVIIHLHNSAFDTSGEIRKQELSKLKSILEEEYSLGHYIVTGGDWNMNPPGFNPNAISGDSVFSIAHGVGSRFLDAGWQWVWDPAVPTNRDVSSSYKRGRPAQQSSIFFFLAPTSRSLK